LTNLNGMTFCARYFGISIGETASESPHNRRQGISNFDRELYHRGSNLSLKRFSNI
jgi:hypothetical protein